MNIYIIFGNNDYFVLYKSKEIIKKIINNDINFYIEKINAFCIYKVDIPNIIKKISESLSNYTINLYNKKILWIKDINFLDQNEYKLFFESFLIQLQNYNEISDSKIVISIISDENNLKEKLLHSLKKISYFLDVSISLNNINLMKFLNYLLNKKNLSQFITYEAKDFLVQKSEYNPRILHQEANKIINFISNKDNIVKKIDVINLISDSIEKNFFDIAELFYSKKLDKENKIKMIKNFLKKDYNIKYLMNYLINHNRTMIFIKIIINSILDSSSLKDISIEYFFQYIKNNNTFNIKNKNIWYIKNIFTYIKINSLSKLLLLQKLFIIMQKKHIEQYYNDKEILKKLLIKSISFF